MCIVTPLITDIKSFIFCVCLSTYNLTFHIIIQVSSSLIVRLPSTMLKQYVSKESKHESQRHKMSGS